MSLTQLKDFGNETFGQFFSASFVYLVLSKTFPARETFMEEPVMPDNFTSTKMIDQQFPSGDEEKVGL